jgi:beta-galactosidase
VGRRISVEFDGAFRDTIAYVNGCYIGRSHSGYVPFQFDITDFLAYGAKNYIALRVDASQGDGWFYEGAGLYRHTWLIKTDAVHLGRWEGVVRSTVNGKSATLALATLVQNESQEDANTKVSWRIVHASGATVMRETTSSTLCAKGNAGLRNGASAGTGMELLGADASWLAGGACARAKVVRKKPARTMESRAFFTAPPLCNHSLH